MSNKTMNNVIHPNFTYNRRYYLKFDQFPEVEIIITVRSDSVDILKCVMGLEDDQVKDYFYRGALAYQQDWDNIQEVKEYFESHIEHFINLQLEHHHMNN